MSLSRREFVAGMAALGVAGATDAPTPAALPSQGELKPPVRPIAVSSANGLGACTRAVELVDQRENPTVAAVAGVKLVEDDPDDHSVGYGGLPNEDGVVELDACVMDGPSHKGGGVAGLRDIRNAASVALQVMRRTDHVLLVGEGAKQFALAHGFKAENLLTDRARRIWLKWKETHSDRDDWIRPEANDEAARRLRELGLDFTYGTITCLALDTSGDLGGCTTTSGLSYKLAGRVGDSPILGAGLYVDNQIGACGSTGRGEANLLNCSSFLVVELMRAGMSPEEACKAVLQRIADRTEPRLRDAQGRPNYGLKLYALRKDGVIGGYSMRGAGEMAVHDGNSARLVKLPGLYSSLPCAKTADPAGEQPQQP